MQSKNSFQQIFKATSVFGGVQIFTILIGIVRVKIIAVLLGTVGVGFIGILMNIVTLVYSFVGLGIPNSSVKFISEQDDENKNKRVIKVVRKLILITGIFGMIFTILFANKISYLVFGNYEKSNIYSIMIIGVAILFYALENGELSILQGKRRIKELAKARIVSSVLGLILTIPIYYLWGINGVAYSIVVIYLVNCVIIFNYSEYRASLFDKIELKNLYIEGKSIMVLGLAMASSTVLMSGASIIVKSIISTNGSLAELGYYEAGFAIVNGYVGLIFVAMAKDYYPRLSLINKDNKKLQEVANQQIEIGLLIVFPILIALTIGVELVLKILYTKDFIDVKYFLYSALLGVVFKLVSWSFSYIVLAKGKGKMFLTYEILGSIILLGTHYYGYAYFGLVGLGLAYLIYNILYFVIVVIVNLIYFDIKLKKEAKKIFMLIIIVTTPIIFGNAYLNPSFKLHIFNILVLLIISYYSAVSLETRIGFIETIKNKLKK